MVRDDAQQRLGLQVVDDPRPIEAVIALRYPEAVSQAGDLPASLQEARLSYCILTEAGGGQPPHRFPDSGWLHGSVHDLAELIRLVSVPQRAVDQAAHALEQGIESAARELDGMAARRPGITSEIARLLAMDDIPATRRMACAIITNAMCFHDRIAGMHDGGKAVGPGLRTGRRQSKGRGFVVLGARPHHQLLAHLRHCQGARRTTANSGGGGPPAADAKHRGRRGRHRSRQRS